MKLDISAAPEIAFWTLPAPSAPHEAAVGEAAEGEAGPGRTSLGGAVARPATSHTPATVGYLAACLGAMVADPQSWWDRVRFDPGEPVYIALDAPSPRCVAWLLVLPPGYQGETRDWEVACLVAGEAAAGEAAERTGSAAGEGGRGSGWRDRPLAPGRTRVRGGAGPYRMINTGSGYSVSLHARSAPAPARAR